jgi:hypothetical protein
MSKPSIVARSALAAAAGAMALSAALTAPQMAAAQAYGYAAPSYSEVCRSDQNHRTALGALLGAGVGAALGSQVAANHHRTDGSIVGGLLGAFGGGALGHNTTPCEPQQAYAAPPPVYAAPPVMAAPPPPPPPHAEYDQPGYYQGRFDDGDDNDQADDDARWAYGHRGERFRIAERPPGPDGCTLAESPIYMPDGRVQKRFVRVCPDSSGRYQVVD